MSDEAAFLKAIKKNPDDATARLVFADWLQDRDDPRAAWVRDADIWEWMKPDAKDPTDKLITAIQRRYRYRQARYALGKLGTTAVPRILSALRDSADGSHILGWVLQDSGPHAEPVLPVLLSALEEKNLRVRTGAFQCLGGLIQTSPAALEAVVAGFEDPDEAIWGPAFGACKASCANEGVRERLRATVPRLHELLHDKHPRWHQRRGAVVELLTALKELDEALIPLLVAMLTDERNRYPASAALSALGAPAVRAVLDAAESLGDPGTGPAAVWAIEGAGAVAVPVLRAALNSPRTAVRQLASVVLPRFPGTQESDATSGLSEALRADNGEQRVAALDALRRLGPAGAAVLPTLVELIGKAQPGERLSNLVHALPGFGSALEPFVPALLNFVTQLPFPTYHEVGWAVGTRGHGPSALLAVLDREDTHDHMPLYLGFEEFIGVQHAIEDAYRDPTARDAMREVARLARRLPPAEAVVAVRPYLSDAAQATRVVAVFALRHLATAEAVAALLTALKDKDRFVRACAVRMLANADGVDDALRAATKDRSKDVRAAATKALEKRAAG